MSEQTARPVMVTSPSTAGGPPPPENKSFLEKFWLPIILAGMAPIGAIAVARLSAGTDAKPEARLQEYVITGLVTDAENEAVSDVDVLVVETNDRAHTSAAGSFSLKTSAAEKVVNLHLARTGFRPRTELVRLPSSGLIIALESTQVRPPRLEPDTEASSPPRRAAVPPPRAPVRTGNIRLQYAGDFFACGLQLTIRLGGQTVVPRSNNYLVNDVSLGAAPYQINGTIACPGAGICNATGTGRLTIEDGSHYNIIWQNTAFGQCNVRLIDAN